MKAFFSVLIFNLLLVTVVQAADVNPVLISYEEVNSSINTCMREDENLNYNYKLTCLKDELAIVDNALNFNYKLMVVGAKFVDRYEGERNALKKLIESQRAWVKYRDADAVFAQNGEAHYQGEKGMYQSDSNANLVKQVSEIEHLIIVIILTFQRSNIFYHYLKGGDGFNYIYPLAVG